MELFRREVIDAKSRPWMGEILLTRPLTIAFFTTVALGIVAILVCFLIWGDYTRKERLSGLVVSTEGSAKVYSPVTGTVVKKFVREGQHVERGELLYIISVERLTAKTDTQRAVGEEIAQKRESLKLQLFTQRQVFVEEQAALGKKVKDVTAQLAQVKREIETQAKRLALNEKTLERFRELAEAKFVSQSQLLEREQEKLEQDSRLQVLQRTELSLGADIAAATSALKSAPLNAQNQLAAIERGIYSVQQENYENEAKREVAVRAPQVGQATAVLSEIGQTVSAVSALLTILPRANLEANLYAPSRAIGFINGGEKVQLRYDAFPYQKYGQYMGVIKSVSRAPLSSTELPHIPSPTEPMYLIKVQLDAQQVSGFGKHFQLQDGMRLEADVSLEKRKLYEWVLAPLYSLTGKW